MALVIDLHVHTMAHSPCSHIDPAVVVRQAIKAGLDGLVITEHYYQWREQDLTALAEASGEPHFLLMAGFEYGSRFGDILIYGLSYTQANEFPRGLEPEDAVRLAKQLGGICIAAHPTRAGMGFDERILVMPVDGIEVASVNLKEHEQRLARQLADSTKLRPVAASDAHDPRDIGRYATAFDYPVQSINDLREAFRQSKFRPATGALTDRGH
jgi:predicted metal-dependent phosphoesterase TrpH